MLLRMKDGKTSDVMLQAAVPTGDECSKISIKRMDNLLDAIA